jgi:hypothetical protein
LLIQKKKGRGSAPFPLARAVSAQRAANHSAANLGHFGQRQFYDFLLDDLLNDLVHGFPPRAFVLI